MKVIVRALVRWSWLLLLCVLLGWFGGKALSNLLPPTYQATSIVQLNAQSRSSQIVLPVAAYGTLVTSDSVLGTALKSYPNLDRQSVSTKALVVTPDNSSQTISIQVALPNAKEAAGLANQLAQLLVKQQNAYIKSQYAKQLQILDGRIKDEQKTIDQLNQKIIQTPSTDTTTIQQLQSQVSQHQTLQSQDINARQTLLTDQALYTDPLAVVQTATAPTKPSAIIGLIPLTPLVLIVVLILGVITIVSFEKLANRINSVYALQQKISLPVLGALHWTSPSPSSVPLRTILDSKLSFNPSTRMIAGTQVDLRTIFDSKLPYAEECRVMMADVLFHAEAAQARVLAITGMKVRSGNSTIAAELAALLAQSKRRILLIDANLYEPSLYKRLGIPNEAGLARMLEEARTAKVGVTPGAGQTAVQIMESLPVDSYIMPTSIENLFILPAGKPTLNPSSLLSMPEMEQFLKWASRRSDYIVIDCPALIHAEAHMLGSLSDQTLLVVDATRDRLPQVANIKDEMMNTGVKLSGLIVNKLGRWI